jgi:hypothetical protein
MSNQPIDLIRQLPHLYHALEGAVMAGGRELDSDYEHELRRLASDMYDAIAEAINACKLSPADTKRAVIALETLRQSPAKRARINAAGRVLMEVPREGAGVLSERRGADVEANLNASAECIHIEANATRTLVNLLHDLAA